MKLKLMIYTYLIICASMILFNIVCALVFRCRERQLDRVSLAFAKKIRKHLKKKSIVPEDIEYMQKELRKTQNLRAFDRTLSTMSIKSPKKVRRYLDEMVPVFIRLAEDYGKRNDLQAAYFPYVIQKHEIFKGKNATGIITQMLKMVRSENLYCRENALQALYSIGNPDAVVKALQIIDSSENYHNNKMLCDGLLKYTGDKAKFERKLWAAFPLFGVNMQVAIIDYFRFDSEECPEDMLQIMNDPNIDREVVYSCIRYFGKYPYEKAYPYLMAFAQSSDNKDWACIAIAATALAMYPGDKTEAVLKKLVSNENWYVRLNASKSLDELGFDYISSIDIIESDDRFASEMMTYRLDQKKLKEGGEGNE